MAIVKTISGESIRLLRGRVAETSKYGEYWQALNSDIKKSYQGKLTTLRVMDESREVAVTLPFGLHSDGTYSLGCKRFTPSTFNKILRHAGAIRQYTRKAKAARAGR